MYHHLKGLRPGFPVDRGDLRRSHEDLDLGRRHLSGEGLVPTDPIGADGEKFIGVLGALMWIKACSALEAQ